MASTPATDLTSVHSHASDSEGASVDSCGSDYADSADRETINKALQVIKRRDCSLITQSYPASHLENPSSF
ncbi:hypothetical protein CHU98_g10242 [Xylaria longipes]|nr:hypothetical protein CHU98_g10242 [Xylaria longipes]